MAWCLGNLGLDGGCLLGTTQGAGGLLCKLTSPTAQGLDKLWVPGLKTETDWGWDEVQTSEGGGGCKPARLQLEVGPLLGKTGQGTSCIKTW